MRGRQAPEPRAIARSSRQRRAHGRRWPLLVAVACTGVLLTSATYTHVGRLATAYVFVVLHFYIGVVALVALSLTVMLGLASTDRILLKIGQRVLLQTVHRATAVLAVVALGVHIAVKVLEAHAAVADAVIPFFSQGRSLFIGFGTVAAYLMLLAYWSGLARSRFAGRVRPWVWRLLHASAYPSWMIAMLHGLNAGRQAATWVAVSYVICLVLVGLGLLVRVLARFGRYAIGVKPGPVIGASPYTAPMPRIESGRRPARTLDGRSRRGGDQLGSRPRLVAATAPRPRTGRSRSPQGWPNA
ncbi:hypothetical protein [Dactylosporangium matsuzakiense]|uniref:DMSO/TMAO reductase YedYZ heme-binding membrane subunit n=1 Tax=Dactylosporangium matsuzakiense TaxID=53360 RepID=A0A9W6KD47_9ACTN|nr:hypothetical protein [Dactylosporangium matsuzakiense]UWZ42256.1 hypothetical protein Dmats_32385 [Dactylosporangium matsuzakiense]GLK99911.1 hypothetical protein GCM10017581_016520 [Dactylosporangium matsuzakiense]